MNIYIDTEFNGYRGELISLALVDEDGRSFYEVLDRHDTPVVAWVAENVIPQLFKLPTTMLTGAPCSLADMQALLEWWLQDYESVHLIADWPEDIEHFCHALITGPGTRIDTPPLTMEVRRDLDAVSELPHNALADALAIRLKHLQLTA